MVNLAKAIKYAGQFASKDKARPVFTYVLIKGDMVVGCDRLSMIRCRVNGEYEPQLISIKDAEILSEPNEYPDVDKFFQEKGFITSITFSNDIGDAFSNYVGLRNCFKTMVIILDTCRKLTSKEEFHKVHLRTKGNKLLIFSGEKEWPMFFESPVSKIDGELLNGNFNAEYLLKVCKILAEINPSEVTMYFFKDRNVLIKADGVDFYVCGIFSDGTDWLSRRARKYCETEKILEDSDLGFLA